MKNVAVLTIVGIFVFSLILSGCGKLGKKDFEVWRDGYVTENNQAHSELRNQDSNLDSKVDAQRTSLMESISQAKEEAITTAQQGDADSIQTSKSFATEQDDALRSELTKAAEMAGQKAQEFAKSEDDGIRKLISDLDSQASSQSTTISGLESELKAAKSDAAKKDLAQRKPMRVATIHFGSGRGSLSQAAKQELDKAITEIKNHGDFIVKVVGHADGRPVLGGMYRSNWDLSQARADAATKYLQGQGVANEIESIGRGHTEPVASAKTADGRNKNRRVEVILYPPGTLR